MQLVFGSLFIVLSSQLSVLSFINYSRVQRLLQSIAGEFVDHDGLGGFLGIVGFDIDVFHAQVAQEQRVLLD